MLSIFIIAIIGLIRIPSVQQFVAQRAAVWLSSKLNTSVKVEGFTFTFLDKLSLDGVFVEDLNKDTLLYAGHLEVKVTDWIFFSDEKNIKYFGLKDAYLNLKRPQNDSVWNYQFIVDAFTSKKEKDTAASSSPSIGLETIDLQNTHFTSIDKWIGEDHEIHIGKLNVAIDQLNFSNKQLAVNSIYFDNSSYFLRDYKGGRPDSLKKQKVKNTISTPFNPDKWAITLNQLELKDCRYLMDNPDEQEVPKGLFYEWKMDIKPVQILAKNIVINSDTLTANLINLSAKDKSGIEIKKMSALVKVSPKISECKNLYLETNNSILRDYYAMHYDRFPDFTDYIAKVRMEGHFNNAFIAMNDIAFFAPEMNLFKGMEVTLNGTGGGTVEKLYANNVTINDGKSNLQVGGFTMNGLPDIETTDMSFMSSKIQTTGINILHYFPQFASVKTIDWYALQKIEAPFEVLGSINDLKVKANVGVALGNILVDGVVNNILQQTPKYNTKLALEKFNIGKLLNIDDLGTVTANLNLDGSGFDQQSINIHTKGTISTLATKLYTYHNATVDGIVTASSFNGKINIEDSNAKVNLEGSLTQILSKPGANFVADIAHLDLKTIGWIEDSVKLSGKLEGDFEGLSIDNLLGEATLKQMKVLRNKDVLDIDSIYLKSLYEDDIRYLYLGTNHLSARIWGDYKILELPQTINHFLAKYLPNTFTAPKFYKTDQLIYFDLKANDVNDLISVFNKNILLEKGLEAIGVLNSNTDIVSLDIKAPKLTYNGIVLDSFYLNGTGGHSAFDLIAGTSKAGYGDNVFLNNLNLNANLNNNLLNFNIKTATPEAFGSATLNGTGIISNDKVYVNILPSKIFINNNIWDIPEGNEIVYEHDKVYIKNLEINSDNQHIYVNKKREPDGGATIELLNLGIAPIYRLLQLDQSVSGGSLEGLVLINDIINDPIIDLSINTKGIKVQDELLQSLTFKGTYFSDKSIIYLDSSTGITDKEGAISLSGSWALGSKNPASMNGLVNFNKAKIAWLSPILKGYVNQLDGRLTGDVTITGNIDNINTDGSLKLLDVQIRPEALGEKYTIADGELLLNKNIVTLNNFIAKDKQNNIAILEGFIKHNNLLSYDFDIKMKSDRFRVLNLLPSDGQAYNGIVDAKVIASLLGPATDVKVWASLEPLENSTLNIPLDFSSDVGSYNYIKFKKQNDFIPVWQRQKLKFSNKYNLRIDAIINNNLTTNIIIDPKTNDHLLSKGEGNIVMEIPSDGDIRLNGNYKIESGIYNFAFRQMQILNYNREFKITPGSTIVWSGSMYDAHLNVTGITSVKARLYDLISSEVNRINISQQDIADAQLAQIINVKLNISNTLQNPEINFKIELTENRSIVTYAYQKLERINADEKQLLNQVASLLLLDQFAPPEGFMNNVAAVSSGTLNNVSDIVSTLASSQLTNLANKLFKVEDLHVGVRYKNYNLNNSVNNNFPGGLDYLNRNEAKVSLRKNFLKNRLLVDVGGVYDWGRPSQSDRSSYTSNLAGDFMVQYLIRKDGRVRFNIFRTSNYDALFQQNISRQGIGLSYRKSFNSIGELLGVGKNKVDTTTKNNNDSATIQADSLITN